MPAVLEAWYPGQAAGSALADVLFGDYNPAGRLPATFLRFGADLPPFSDYAMKGRTYRFFEGRPLYPFGYGLSYTRFEYSRLSMPASVAAGESFEVRVDVRNVGTRAGEEVVQLYVRDKQASVPVPLRSLQGFRRILLNPGESRTVVFPDHTRPAVPLGSAYAPDRRAGDLRNCGRRRPAGGGGAAIASTVRPS